MSFKNSSVFIFAWTVIAGVSLFAASPAKAQTPDVRDLLQTDRGLQPHEIARVMEAVRSASEGKAFRLYDYPENLSGMFRLTVLMGSGGRPRYVHDSRSLFIQKRGTEVHIAEYSARPARSCYGDPLGGELQINYLWRSRYQQWEVVTDVPDDYTDPYERYFQILSGKLRVESGELTTVGGRKARLLIAPWKDLFVIMIDKDGRATHGDPAVDLQSLAIDVETLLPVRWETVDKESGFRSGVVFAFDPSMHIELPSTIERPDCVSGSGMFSVR
jgi:hypothetical protein